MFINHFDVDGTITYPGHDFWFAICRDVLPSYFESTVLPVLAQADADSAYLAMSRTCEYISSQNLWSEVDKSAQAVAKNAVKNGVFRPKALSKINELIGDGNVVVFQTANFRRAATVIIETLIREKLLNRAGPGMMPVYGSLCNYDSGQHVFCNFGPGKLQSAVSVSKVFGEDLASASAFYCDDPEHNDAQLLSAVRAGYIVRNIKNESVPREAHVELIDWD